MLALALSFVAGLLTALSPCVLPLLPIIVGSAATAGRLGPVVLASGLVTAFTVVGVLLASVQSAIGLDDIVVRKASASVLLLAGVMLMSTRLQELAERLAAPLATSSVRVSSRLGSGLAPQFAVGIALGGVWSPCVGPTLGAAIGLAAHTETMLRAISMMVAFGLGATIPLLGAAYASHAVLSSRGVLLHAGSRGKIAFGVASIVMGVLVWLGADKAIEAAILARLPGWWIDILAGV